MFSLLMLNILTAKVLPIIIPPLIAVGRTFIVKRLPPAFIPFALTVGGALVDVAATSLGVDGIPADLPMLGAAAWEGALVGLAATGLHQGWKQGREWFKALKQK